MKSKMDVILDDADGFARECFYVWKTMLIAFLYIALIVTTPVWIVPYLAWKKLRP